MLSLQDVENELLHRSFLDQRKKEMLYKKWSERIFAPIQSQMYQAMKGNYAAVDRKKRELFNEYIKHRNKKVMITQLYELKYHQEVTRHS